MYSPNSSPLGSVHYRTLQIISWVALSILLAIIVISYWSSEKYQSSRMWRDHSDEVVGELRELKISLISAESAQRGYIISRRQSLHEDYNRIRSDINLNLEALKKLVADNPEQVRLLAELEPVIEERFQVLEDYVAFIEKGDQKGADALMHSGRGVILAQKIEALLRESENTERALIKSRDASAKSEFDFATTLVAGGLIAAFMLLLMVTSLLKSQLVYRLKIEKELRLAQKAANTASELKSSFLANMSHEIRTPLNGIMGMTKMLDSTPLSAEQKDFLETIKISSNSLMALINQILDFSKIESGKMQLEEVPFELKSLINGTISVVNFAAKAKGLKINLNIAKDLPEFYLGDALRLRQVILNLLNNSVKFSDRGTIDIEVKMIKAWDSKVTLEFSVKDQGVGLDDKTKERLFQVFTQGDDSTSRRYGGSGLGLAISKQIVELMRGSISVESRKGEGSRFYFQIDLKVSKFKSDMPIEASVSTRTKALGGSILIAEDNQVNQKVIAEMMRLLGCSFRIVFDGKQVLQALKEERFDLILMDGQMPEMDGYEATRLIRIGDAGVEAQKIPIIATTANAIKGDIEKCIAAGMNGYIGKPISFDDLAYKVEKWLERGYRVIDQAAIKRLVDLGKASDPRLLQKLVQMFEQDSYNAIQAMKKALVEKDFSEVSTLAHTMKSSSANLGALRLRDIYERIEKAKFDPVAEHILLLVEAAEKEYEFAMAELKAMV